MTVRIPVRRADLFLPDAFGTYRTAGVLSVLDGQITVDEGWSPRTQATLVISRPSAELEAKIDPYSRTSRVLLRVQGDAAAAVRTFDLKLTATQVNHDASTIGMNLQSDEALLQDFALVASTPDRSAWLNQGSVETIVTQVIRRAIPDVAVSAPYAPQTRLPTYVPATNMIPNGTFEGGAAAPWSSPTAAIGPSTVRKRTGSYSLAIAPLSTNADTYADLTVDVEPGATYSVHGIVFTMSPSGLVDPRARRIWVYTYIDGQVVMIAQSDAPSLALTGQASGTKTRVTFTAPPTSKQVYVRLYNGYSASPSAASNTVYWDDVIMVEGDRPDSNLGDVPYFDGATPDTTEYRYDWTGPTWASPSTRTPLIDRPADALTWSPGQTAWDFLTPILQASGLRLVTASTRGFSLVRVADTVASGNVLRLAASESLYALEDLESRTAARGDGTPLFADAVLVHYTWNDSQTGDARETWETAGPVTAQRPYVVERPDTAFPGPGAAPFMLRRLALRQRQLTVRAAEDYSFMPGQEALVTDPAGAMALGIIDAETWDFASATTTVRVKALLSVERGAIGVAPDGQAIGSVAGTIANYTN